MQTLKKIHFYFDFYIGYFLYNANSTSKYKKYMKDKWGDYLGKEGKKLKRVK